MATAISGVRPFYMVNPCYGSRGGKNSGTSKKKSLTSSSTTRKCKSIAPESISCCQSPRLHQNSEPLPPLPTSQHQCLGSLCQIVFGAIAKGHESDLGAIAEGKEDEEVPPSKLQILQPYHLSILRETRVLIFLRRLRTWLSQNPSVMK